MLNQGMEELENKALCEEGMQGPKDQRSYKEGQNPSATLALPNSCLLNLVWEFTELGSVEGVEKA